MASCLYECLCEAELEKYYPQFVALGLQKIDELAKIAMKDYAKLGIHNMNDRKRLFQLIRIIKIMQEEEEGAGTTKQDFQPCDLYIQPQVTRSGPRRQLHFESLFEKKDGAVKDCELELQSFSDFCTNKEKESLVEILGHVLPEDSEDNKITKREILNVPGTCTQNELDCPTIYSSNNIAHLLGDSEAPIIQRVTHISGYNYGLPHSCIRSSTSEKEVPWTETDKIRVCVRKRPLGLREERRGEVNIIRVEDKETLLLHEKKEAVDLTQYILQHVFYFDEVFGEACTNQDVYMKTAHPLIQHIFNGGNATCFAYGQTGAGKTYTMIGSHQNPGLYALAAKDIFRQLEASQSRRDLCVWISFYEIYCGQLYDLLNGRRRLFAREDSKHVVQIVGLREVQVDTVDLLLEVILKGGKERSTGATGVNSDSSRSHAIIQIQIKDSANRTFGRISFIDLAGSERAADARDSDKQTKMEGAEINQSLLALKECIRALDQEHAHTPFRQSKLTQVLKDSFIGNSKTCMIANVSPSHIATEHTLNTLRYADRVKELKKGIKCCTPVTNRCRIAGNVSPKRIQNSPSAHVGDKSSPKKVKLGLHHPLSSLRIKASPSVFHPTNVPFSSTPKGAKSHAHKGNPSSPWLNHTSPIKGTLKIGHPMKKKTDDLTLPSEKHHTAKDFVVATAAVPETRESGQGDNCIQDKQPVRCLKVQTVQPVQKQLISRNGFSFGDGNHPSDSSQRSANVFTKQCIETWENLPPHQKEREQHLRLYHQQFQQPPILQQKLNYQPLERFLAQYKPQETGVKQDQILPPTDSQCKEGMLLEDLDDSDFSEDSFSPISSQRKVKRNTSESSQLSFFLHQREQESEEEKGRERQGLFFEHVTHTHEHELTDSWDYGKGFAFPEAGEPIRDGESSKTRSDWSTEDDFTIDSSVNNNTAEKPYCLQEELVSNWKNSKDLPADHKQYKSEYRPLVYPGESSTFPEKRTQSPQVPHTLDLGTTKCNKISLPHAQREESIKDGQAPAAGNLEGKKLKNGTSPCGAFNTSSEFTSELMVPLTMSLLDSEEAADAENILSDQEKALQVKQMLERKTISPSKRLEGEARQFLRNKASPTGRMPELGEQMDHSERKSTLQHSPQTENKWLSQSCRDAKPSCGPGGSSSWNTHRSSINGLFVRDEDLTEASASVRVKNPCGENEDELFLHNLKCREYLDNSRQYDADTENTTGSLLSGPEKSSLGKGPNVGPTAQTVHADLPEKGYFSFAPSILNAGRVEGTTSSPSREGSPLQPRSEFRSKDLNHSEDTFKLSFSGEEIGLLKNKLMQSIFTQDCFDAAQQDSRSVTKEIRSLANQNTHPNPSIISTQIDTSETSNRHREALGKAQQVVIQAHREQLDEMASLCFKEETLINQMSAADFENYVTKLDEILMLKSKCIQSMRAQLQLYLACPETDATLQRTTTP
ncbi:kinesin-like protein KIF24 [Chelonoidis abingdonii]|uniref:kinesin-like protein KIF24 n=1 Tax=Chelonoidis abingdonii TaxID=106734 RepID=UPI0013F2456F|nr:kinesin-like protein KIF24 [Chelonoidis abingdonii]